MLRGCITALLLSLSHPPAAWSGLAWVALTPLLHLGLYGTKKQVIAGCWLCGMMHFAVTLFWLRHVSWAGWIACVLYLSMYWLGMGWCWHRIRRRTRGKWLGMPSAWVVMEMLRGHVPVLSFPWANLAHTQVSFPLFIQHAEWLGVECLGGIVVIVNLLLLTAWERRRAGQSGRAMLHACAAIGVVLSCTGAGWLLFRSVDMQSGASFALIQANIPQHVKSDQNDLSRRHMLREHIALSCQAAAQYQPDCIVWPETMVPGDLARDHPLKQHLENLSTKLSIPLLVGAIHGIRKDDGYKAYNSAHFIAPGQGLLWRYDKNHLVPFGEFVPFSERLAVLGAVNFFQPGATLAPEKIAGMNVGISICFEDTLEKPSHVQVRMGARCLINLTNDGWFKDSAELQQHLACAVFRSIETRTPLVRATNTGISALITPRGTIDRMLEVRGRRKQVRGILFGAIQTGPGIRVDRSIRMGIFYVLCIAMLWMITAEQSKKPIGQFSKKHKKA